MIPDKTATTSLWISRWLEKGYVHAWFDWITWTSLTAVLWSLVVKQWPNPSSWPVILLAAFSTILVFLAGIIGFSTYLVETTDFKKWPAWARWVLIYCLSVSIPTCLLITITPLIYGLLEASH